MRILLVEDEIKVAHFIRKGLKQESYAVDVVHSGEEALQEANANDYDLLILDIMLPGKDGISVCKEMRTCGVTTPILLLTARDAVEDKVQGLDSGADDYLTKPFRFEEFLARVRSLIRRNAPVKMTKISLADLELDQLKHEVKRAGQKITLTAREYALLEYLMLNANRLVSRTMLLEHVWERDFDSLSNTVEVYINFLRRKIDKGYAKPLLHTVYGRGYMLSENRP